MQKQPERSEELRIPGKAAAFVSGNVPEEQKVSGSYK